MTFKVVFEHGAQKLQGSQLNGRGTDADGNFSVSNLVPGRYYLHAMDMRARLFAGLTQDRLPKATPEDDVATFYPS
jgi:hypothetical protein